MIDFLAQFWPYIAIACFEVCSIVFYLLILRKKGISSDAVKVIISEKLPGLIKLAEASGLDGKLKASMVVDSIYKCIKTFIKKTDQVYWLAYIREAMEAALSTPQKKEVIK